MADQDLSITGRDVSIEMLVDGIPQKITDKVVSFETRPRYDTIEVKHLGTSDVDIDKEPTGWEGTVEVSRKTGALDDMINAYNLARRNRVPILISFVETVRFRDGTSRTYLYPDVKIEFGTSYTRGQATTSRIPWVCGTDRI